MFRFARTRALGRATLGLALLLTLAGVRGLDAQSQRVPGPASDNLVDVLITFRSTPVQADEAIVRGVGGTVRHRYHLVPGMAARLPSQAIAALQANPRIVTIEPDGQVFAINVMTELNDTWGVKYIGAGDVHVAPGEVGTGVKVAIIDSGIDYTHPDLAANYAFGHNFVNGTTNPMDDNGHGTHVAGTVAAVRNGTGVVGVAPGVQLVGLKVLNASGSGSWSNIIAAVQYAVDNRISITNNSYGAGSNPGTLVQAAFDNSAAAGVLHIAAAGNSGNCAGNNNTVGFPARYASVVAVAAVNSSDQRACFSGTGSTLELSAPGVSIPSTIPGGGYASYSGTSMASPHVAGVAALVKGTNPALSSSAIRQTLTDTARSLGATNHYGRGLVQAAVAVAAAGSTPDTGGGTSGTQPPPATGTARVSDITYRTSGGKNGTNHLSVTVALADEHGTAIAGASVAVQISGSSTASATATTGTNGTVSFTWNNAPAGCYTTVVTNVSAPGLSWDGETPANQGCK